MALMILEPYCPDALRQDPAGRGALGVVDLIALGVLPPLELEVRVAIHLYVIADVGCRDVRGRVLDQLPDGGLREVCPLGHKVRLKLRLGGDIVLVKQLLQGLPPVDGSRRSAVRVGDGSGRRRRGGGGAVARAVVVVAPVLLADELAAGLAALPVLLGRVQLFAGFRLGAGASAVGHALVAASGAGRAALPVGAVRDLGDAAYMVAGERPVFMDDGG